MVLFAWAGAAADAPDAFALNKLIGCGISIGNALEAPVEGDWGVTIEEEYSLSPIKGLTKFVADGAIAHGFSFTYWDFCAEYFGLCDPPSKSWRQELLEAVVPPAANKTDGSRPPKQ